MQNAETGTPHNGFWPVSKSQNFQKKTAKNHTQNCEIDLFLHILAI